MSKVENKNTQIRNLFLEGEFERTYQFCNQTWLVLKVDENSMKKTRKKILRYLEKRDKEQAHFDFQTDFCQHNFVDFVVEDWEIEDETFPFRGRVKVFYDIRQVSFEIV